MNNNKNKKIIFIITLFSASACFAESDVLITPYDGSAYVSGYVSSDDQAIVLQQLVDSLPNVDADIENVNIGQSSTPLPDEMLTAKINGGFMRAALFGTDANFDDITIKVETNDGVVTLTGSATSEQQLTNAIAIAKLVAGVKAVESRVAVNN